MKKQKSVLSLVVFSIIGVTAFWAFHHNSLSSHPTDQAEPVAQLNKASTIATSTVTTNNEAVVNSNASSATNSRTESTRNTATASTTSVKSALGLPDEMYAEYRKQTLELYAPLLNQLSLTPEEKARLETLLIQKMGNNLSYYLVKNNTSPDPMQATAENGESFAINPTSKDPAALIKERDAIEGEIKATLNSHDYEKYDYFDKTSQERAYVNEIKAALVGNDSYLEESQENQLIDEAYRLKTSFTSLMREQQLIDKNKAIPHELEKASKEEEQVYATKLQELLEKVLSKSQIQVVLEKMSAQQQ